MTGTLDGLFAASAARWPDRTALEVDGRTLTYAELAAWAASIGAGIAPGDRVGLLTARVPLTYAAYLGILRAGGTVIPMNPSHPRARHEQIVAATAPRLIIADDGVATEPIGGVAVRVPGDPGDPGPLARSTPDGVAYIMFTSGSTGVPKGVPTRHREVMAAVATMVDQLGVGEDCRSAQNCELTFDASVIEIFPAWAAGGTLVVPRRGDAADPVSFIDRSKITHWFAVPPVAELPIRTGRLTASTLPSLRHVSFGGDRLLPHQAVAWARAAVNAEVHHFYGPTEVAVACTHMVIGRHGEVRDPAANGTLPIGRVFDHLEYVILGDDGRPADTGELCLRGSQRFGGYLDPSDNAGRFVRWAPGTAAAAVDRPDAGCYYRTGDIVTAEDGLLVFDGRRDGQIKVRGNRVETGEVEAVLRQHPGVEEGVVVLRAGPAGPQLVAVYTGEPVPAAELVRFVRHRLPIVMVPSRFVRRDALPLTGNGKIDRHALAEGD